MSSTDWEKFANLIEVSEIDEVDFESAIKVDSFEHCNPTRFSHWPAYMLKEMLDGIRNSPSIINNSLMTNSQSSDARTFNNIFNEDTNQNLLHPMDIFLYVFFSCEKIFRQIFCTQVAKCQLALPLIVKNQFSGRLNFYNFAFKTLTKDYYSANECSKSFSVTDAKLPIVSFVRLGDCDHSKKSQILNEILGMNHSYFFNRNCQDSIKSTYFFKSTVEIGWYLPKKEEKKINIPFVLLNLRGNACHFPNLLSFLSKVSTLICVFIPYNILNSDIEKVILNLKKDYEENLLYLIYRSPNQVENNISSLTEYLQNSNQKLVLNDDNATYHSATISKKINSLINVDGNLSLTNCIEIAKQNEMNVDSDEEIIIASANKIQEIVDII